MKLSLVSSVHTQRIGVPSHSWRVTALFNIKVFTRKKEMHNTIAKCLRNPRKRKSSKLNFKINELIGGVNRFPLKIVSFVCVLDGVSLFLG